MGDLLVVDSVVDGLLSSEGVFTVFGFRDFVCAGAGYDFLFHAVPGFHPGLDGLLAVPVLPYSCPRHEDRAVSVAYQLHERFPFLDLFAARDSCSRNIVRDGHRDIVNGSLVFFDVDYDSVSERSGYCVAGLCDVVSDPSFAVPVFREVSKRIDDVVLPMLSGRAVSSALL